MSSINIGDVWKEIIGPVVPTLLQGSVVVNSAISACTIAVYSKLAAGSYNSLTLRSNKNGLYSWGYNNFGQLGDNSITSKLQPYKIYGNKTFCQISSGYGYSIAIDKNSKAWGWGYNHNGQLGDNTIVSKLTPVSILGANKTFCIISSGYDHSMVIDKNGKIWCWGRNNWGQLGDYTIGDKYTPVSILGTNKTFCQISAGHSHSLAIDKNGKLWGWGYNLYGNLGDNTAVSKCTPVAIFGNHTFCSISAGWRYSLAIDNNGKAWGFGYNVQGQLGDNTVVSKRTPVSIYGNKTFCSISCNYHSIGIDKNGKGWGWGYNNSGQLGDNSIVSRRTPVSILGTNKTFCSISAGYNFSLAIDKNGKEWSWGINNYGQLGDNTIVAKCTPVAINTVFEIDSFSTVIYSGNTIDDGGGIITSVGSCWSDSPNPTIYSGKTIDGNSIGSFTSVISGITKEYTKYYVRGYATNNVGTGYSPHVTFISNGTPVGQTAYTITGTYTWIAPSGVTSVCVVCVGPGSTSGGGALAWKNYIQVIPGSGYTVYVAAGGTTNRSYFKDTSTVSAANTTNRTGDGGGDGGGVTFGGGAGGYTGPGGVGTWGPGGNGQGGGGGAGATSYDSCDSYDCGGGGGGVGIFGAGVSGLGGVSADSQCSLAMTADPGKGGSGGSDGTYAGSQGSPNGNGGNYGGGVCAYSPGTPGGGAVRIIWGSGRSFPSTLTTDQPTKN